MPGWVCGIIDTLSIHLLGGWVELQWSQMPGRVGGITDTPSSGESRGTHSWFFSSSSLYFSAGRKSTIHWCCGFAITSKSVPQPTCSQIHASWQQHAADLWIVDWMWKCFSNLDQPLDEKPIERWSASRRSTFDILSTPKGLVERG